MECSERRPAPPEPAAGGRQLLADVRWRLCCSSGSALESGACCLGKADTPNLKVAVHGVVTRNLRGSRSSVTAEKCSVRPQTLPRVARDSPDFTEAPQDLRVPIPVGGRW